MKKMTSLGAYSKFILASLIVLLASISLVSAYANFAGLTNVEYFNWTDAATLQISSASWRAQTFLIGGNGTNEGFMLVGVSLKMYRSAVTQTFNVSVTATDANNLPVFTDTLSSNGTIDNTGMTQNVNGEWFNITLPQVRLNKNTRYAIVVKGGTLDTSDLRWREATTEQYLFGNASFSNDAGGTFTNIPNEDGAFGVYGVLNSSVINITTLSKSSFISPSSIFEANLSGINLQNATFYIWNSTKDIINQTNISISGYFNHTSVNLSGISKIGNYTFNVYGCANDGTMGYCAWGQNQSFYYGITINSVSYNSATTSGSLENFNVNVTLDSTSYSGVSVTLVYNNTNYSMSTSDAGNNKAYSTNLNVPYSASSITKSFNISFVFSSGGELINILSNTYTQNIGAFLIDNCSMYEFVLMNFTMVDEETLAKINGTIEINTNIYSYGTSNLVTSYNNTFNYVTTEDSKICLANITSNYSLQYSIRHFANQSLYYKKYRNIQNMRIDNFTLSQNITLYNLLQASGTTFNILVVGSPTGSNDNLLVDIQKEYVADADFKLVESPITDNDGNSIGHLSTGGARYNFIVSSNGVSLGTFNNYQVKCQNALTGQCTVTLNLAKPTINFTDFINYGNITLAYVLNRTTKTLYTTFNTLDGNSHNVAQVVLANDGYDNTTICSLSSYGTSGTLTCPIPTVYQNTTFYSRITSDGAYMGTAYFTMGEEPNYYGVDIIIELLMFSCLVFIMIANPITIVIGAILGTLFSILLLYMSAGSFGSILGAFIFYLVGGGIIIWQISKKIF